MSCYCTGGHTFVRSICTTFQREHDNIHIHKTVFAAWPSTCVCPIYSWNHSAEGWDMIRPINLGNLKILKTLQNIDTIYCSFAVSFLRKKSFHIFISIDLTIVPVGRWIWYWNIEDVFPAWWSFQKFNFD